MDSNGAFEKKITILGWIMDANAHTQKAYLTAQADYKKFRYVMLSV